MVKLKIGIIGCGAIGGSLAKIIVKDFSQSARLSALYDIEDKKSKELSQRVSGSLKLAVRTQKELIGKAELVIESSSAQSSWSIAQDVLKKGRDIMIMSVGGITNKYQVLMNLALKYGAKVYIPSGAIAGIDALKAARLGRIRRVTLTTRKNPLSFKGVKFVERKKINLRQLKSDTILFSGTAQEGVKFFPQNINVAGILSLAGLGEKKTHVKVIASPGIKKNVHEIKIDSEAATIFTRTENILHPLNPKTSYLAVLSAVAVLRQVLDPVKIGT